MSLLWRTAVWWSGDPDDEYEYEEGLRDPEEHPKERGQRYVSQVVDRHNVTRGAAEKAIKHVIGHHADDSVFRSPAEYGFASVGNQANHYSPQMQAKLMDPATWRGRKVEQVSLNQPIHATQDFIRPGSIAHNLFHPGKRESEQDEAVGDPDYDPDWDADSRAEMDDMSESTPEERELHKNTYFMRRNNGKLEVVDGHHRVATDMLLGKSHTPGIVIHEREINK